MDIPRTLRDRLRADKVIPFVGAGVSMSVLDRETDERLFPSWRELLERAANRLEEENKTPYARAVRSLLDLDKPDYLDAARRAREGLGEAIWYDFLGGQFDHQRERAKAESLKLARAVWNLKSYLVITTNYDDVLHWALPPNVRPEVWDTEAPAEMAAYLRGGANRPVIWHLHGHIHNKSKIILTRDGYSHLYPEAEENKSIAYYQAALQTLHSLLASHTFLFIGFSLDDAYFGMQMEGISSIYQGATGPHYVLARKADIARGLPFNDIVQPIPFERFGEPLLELVQELGAIAGSRGTDEPPPQRTADYNPHNSYFSVPFRPKGNQVIGREKALQDVRTQLMEGRSTAIGQAAAFQGLGGLGKTQLAVEYAHRYKDTYPNGVIWLNADQDIDAQLTDLAEKARWIAPESEHKYKLQIALHRLRTSSDCLIIFDNLEDPQTIANYLPEPTASPHILVTSRTDQPDFNPIPLDPLDDTLSFDLLLQEAGREPIGEEEEKAAREIARTLGGLPLALELAGAYLRHRQISWQQYKDLLALNLRAALPGKLGSFTRHEADLYRTLKINEEVFKEDAKLKEILDLLTWSGSSPMGLSLMCALLNIADPVELTNALGLGKTLRLLQQPSDADGYSIHRLVGEVRREEIPLQDRQDWVNTICQRIGDWFDERREHYIELPRFEAEIDHLQAWQENASRHAPNHSSRLIWLQAYPSYHRGNYLETKEWVQKALELVRQGDNSDRALEAHLFNDLGVCYGNLGDYKRCLKYAEKALSIRLELFGERHPDTAQSLNNVGGIYGELGDYKRNLEYTEKALNIRLELFGERHPDTAQSLSSVGNTYGTLGDYKRNLEYVEKALSIRLELFGERHPDTAQSFSDIGSAFSDLGDYKRNLEYAEKALSVRLELFGKRHPNTARSLNNVGAAYGNLGDHKRNLEYAEKSLSIRLELFGERHPDTAWSFDNVGGAYSNLGDHKRDLEYSEKALSIRLELFGERHPDTAQSLDNVGTAYGNLGDYKRNLEYIERAVKLRRDVLGDMHPETVSSVRKLVNLLTNLNRRPEAFRLLEEFLPRLPKDHIHYDGLKRLEQRLLAEPIRPGFRQPSSKSQGQKRKKKKKRR
ncbi:MAG TPA: tetratricopeptide repeat protein [Pyrinomonadaceae bacterium]|jgi:tetratricopeptide (TPR) repeat protein